MGEVFEGFGYENVEDDAEEANNQGQLNELEISELKEALSAVDDASKKKKKSVRESTSGDGGSCEGTNGVGWDDVVG